MLLLVCFSPFEYLDSFWKWDGKLEREIETKQNKTKRSTNTSMSNRSRHALIYSPVSSNLLRQLLAINIFFSNSNSIWFCFCSKCKKKVFKRKYYKWKQTKHIAVDNQNGRQAGRQAEEEEGESKKSNRKSKRETDKEICSFYIDKFKEERSYICVCVWDVWVCVFVYQFN